MKMIKKSVWAVLSLLMTGGLFAQAPSEVATIEGKNGTMKIFDVLSGFNDVSLSRNGKFFFGKFEQSNGFVYDIEADSIVIVEGYGIVEMKDWDNYLTTSFAVVDGKKYELSDIVSRYDRLTFDAASEDIRTIKAFCYVGSSYDNVLFETLTGKAIDTLDHKWPDHVGGGFGSMALGMSNDATVLAGRSSAPFALSNFSPVFWDRQLDTCYYIGGEERGINTDGSLYAANNDGSLICGDMGESAVVVKYDRQARSFVVERIPLAAGCEVSYSFCVSEKGQVLGVDQVSTVDVYSRKAFLYDAKTSEKYDLNEYLSNLYGLEAESVIPLFSAGSISDDGRIIAGFSYRSTAWVPYLIQLDENQTHALVRNLVVKQIRGTANVSLSWNAPLNGQYTLQGYNVYRDSVKVNAQLIGPDVFTFTDQLVQAGKHDYAVEAVYTDGQTSGFTEEISLLVVSVDGCLPVQEISSEIVYNRTVKLSWGLPSADLAVESKQLPKGRRPENSIYRFAGTGTVSAQPKSYTGDVLDLISVFPTNNLYASAAVRVGDYYYVGQFMSEKILVFNAVTGALLKDVSVEGLSGIYDMAYHDHALYVVNNDQTIRVLSINPDDPFDITMGNQWQTSQPKLVHIAYVENGDGEDFLATGYYDNVVFCPINPIDPDDVVEGYGKLDIEGLIICGSEAHNGRLYLADQSATNMSSIVILDMESGERIGTTDAYSFPKVVEAAGNGPVAAAGLCKSTLDDGTVALQLMVQPSYEYNSIVTVEIESAPGTLGYNVYRNGEKVNQDLIRARHFSEDVKEAGTYEYVVEYVSDKCSSKSSDVGVSEKVIIYEADDCVAPRELSATESNRQAVLSWTFNAEESEANLVGFNVYRNGQLIEDELLDLKYVDGGVEKGNTYLYRIEAFYDNSCTASDSVEIDITFEGSAQAPSLVKVDAEKTGDGTWKATASWDLPYFEEPMALGYCNVPFSAVSLTDFSQAYAMIGWDTASMENFKDLYLIGMEYIIGAEVFSLNGVVFIDNQMVYNEPTSERIRVGDWNRLYFSQTFPMQQKMEIAVGYAISYDPENTVGGNIVFDLGPGKPGYSDLISPDANNWYTLAGNNIDANLCINALVVRKRDLEQSAKMADPMAYLKTKVMRVDQSLALTDARPVNAPKTTSESFSLQGFNVYRDGEKLNDEILQGFRFEDSGLKDGEYEYSVGAVYEGSEEMVSDPVYLELTPSGVEGTDEIDGVSIYPNPVSDILYIRGEYRSLAIMDLNGKVVMRDIRNAGSVSFEGFAKGSYFLRFLMEDGQYRVVKIVKR